MIIAITDSNEDNFAIRFNDPSKADIVADCMERGLGAWYAATDPESYEDDLFTKEDIEGFYDAGYAEPTMELLKRNGIEFECVDIEYDENNKIIADEVIHA